MYRVLPPFWMRAHGGRVVVSSCASDLSIEAARELAAVLDEVIAAAVAQERGTSQAALPSIIVPPFDPGCGPDLPEPHDDGEAERAALLPPGGDRKREAAGDGDDEELA